MIFHYIDGALVCEIKIRGLTQTLPEYNELSSRFHGYRDPEDEDQWWWAYDMDPSYGGYRYFVCESLTRRAAQMIVDALGGYLVPERIPPSRQLGTGGPFHVHQFSLDRPSILWGHFQKLADAQDATANLFNSHFQMGCISDRWFRIYDDSGYMLAELKG